MDWGTFTEKAKGVGFDYASQPKTTATECNICGGSEFAPWLDVDRYGFGVHTVVCVHCGLVFANPRMTLAAFAEFYAAGTYRRLSDMAYEASHGRPKESSGDIAPCEDLTAGLADAFGSALEPLRGGVAVDLGGDTGAIARWCHDTLDMQLTVIDPAAKDANIEDGLSVLAQPAEAWRPAQASVDLVVCLRSVEHLDDPSAVMRQVRHALKPGGVFLVSVVRFEDWWSQFKDPSVAPAAMAAKIDHPYSFNSPALITMLLRSGLCPRPGGARRAQSDYILCDPVDPVRVLPNSASTEKWLADLGLYRAALRNYGGQNGHSTD